MARSGLECGKLDCAMQVEHLEAIIAQWEAQAAKDALPAPEGWRDSKELHAALDQARAAADAATASAQVSCTAFSESSFLVVMQLGVSVSWQPVAVQHTRLCSEHRRHLFAVQAAREEAAALHVQLNAARQQAKQAEHARVRLQQALASAEASERLQQQRSSQPSPSGARSGLLSVHDESIQCVTQCITCKTPCAPASRLPVASTTEASAMPVCMRGLCQHPRARPARLLMCLHN